MAGFPVRPIHVDREARRLASVLSHLLAPAAFRDPESWPLRAAAGLRDLVAADAAVVALEGGIEPSYQAVDLDDAVVRAYADHYGSVDLGIARQRAQRLPLWTRRRLWGRDELVRSEYYSDFALKHALHDAVGLAAYTHGRCLRVTLLFERADQMPASNAQRLRLLSVVLPAFQSGVVLHVQRGAWLGSLREVIDSAARPLAVCNRIGRVMHRNSSLAEVLALDTDGAVAAAVRQVSCAVAAPQTSPTAARYVLAVAGAAGRWNVQASRLEWEPGGESSTVLVALVPPTPMAEAASAFDLLLASHGLTSREREVFALLRRRYSNAEVAQALRISEHTARHHTENVLLKLGIHSRRQIGEIRCGGTTLAQLPRGGRNRELQRRLT